MKKNFRFMAMAVVAMAATVFTGCSSDDGINGFRNHANPFRYVDIL